MSENRTTLPANVASKPNIIAQGKANFKETFAQANVIHCEHNLHKYPTSNEIKITTEQTPPNQKTINQGLHTLGRSLK